jgi:hypothetical protein
MATKSTFLKLQCSQATRTFIVYIFDGLTLVKVVTFDQFQSGEGKVLTIKNFSGLKSCSKKMFNEKFILIELKAHLSWNILNKPKDRVKACETCSEFAQFHLAITIANTTSSFLPIHVPISSPSLLSQCLALLNQRVLFF